MEKKRKKLSCEPIELNNGSAVVAKIEASGEALISEFFTMVQGNSFGGVQLSDTNVQNNSKFIADLWD